MTYKAYIDNIKAKTGKDPEFFQALAKEKGLAKHSDLLTWLKSDCGLGHGHANAMNWESPCKIWRRGFYGPSFSIA
ncbi:MAG: DUF4287 domain-containing protein [Methanobacteriota archaeon]|nr:MAG: DUF4287 domain-containing protein [Euryarchaeota archaeon]